MRIDAVRSFNRFYTRRIGVLRAGLLGTPYTLPEARLLYELGHRGQSTATELGAELDLDLGYLSRLVQTLTRRGLLHGRTSAEDARRSVLSLTAKGRKAFGLLDSRSRKEIGAMLAPLAKGEQSRLVSAMQAIKTILNGERGAIKLRSHRPGDMGWVVQSHGEVYAREYGWDERFEALVADIVAKFVQNFDARRERCWIAEMDGERVGSAFVVRQSKTVAKLRLLVVEPRARGLGLGKRLAEECIRFARASGYRTLVLWTQSNLAAARAIYKQAGFKLVRKERHQSFGTPLVGEYWALEL